MGTVRNAVTLGVGGLGLAAAAALYLRPAVVFELVPEVATRVRRLEPSEALLVAVGLLVVVALLELFASLFSRGAGGTDATAEGKSAASTEALYGAGSGTVDRFGEAVDDWLETAVDYEGTDEGRRREARDALVERLRDAAATAYAQSTGEAREAAESAVAAGEWTDRRRAAGLLAGEAGPSVPVHLWLLDLLLGRDPFVEGVERSLAANAELNGDPLDVGSDGVSGAGTRARGAGGTDG